ncbi:beta propeller repeat protein [Dyadobacter linearis]|nr:hypothetical protein [Dyadobacter sp. CECT 9623]
MKTFLYCLAFVVVLSCKNEGPEIVTQPDTVLDEYQDWYTLKAPVDRQIAGVWGDYDKTVLISTMFQIFRTTDHGKHWEQVYEQKTGMFGIVQFQDTLFTMNGLSTQSKMGDQQQILTNADNFSVDDGKTWHRYVARNPILGGIPEFESKDKFRVNPIAGPGALTYEINRVFLDGPNATTGVFETPGVITSTGRRIDLPQLHQLQSLFLDDQQRLYITGSDAVCSNAKSGVFNFCNSKAGRGVVYISKRPLL